MVLAKRENWLQYFALFVCGLALANLLFTFIWLAGIHPHYWYVWRVSLGQAIIVSIAAFALLSKRKWTHALAAFAVGPVIYDYVIDFIAPWGCGPLAQTAAANGVTPELWWEFVKRHPAELVTPMLALLIVFYAIVKALSGRRKPAAQNLL